ncbi:MAG: NAD-dependent epimerase/dehydratase family protein [Erysipelotrichaceae bacterium]
MKRILITGKGSYIGSSFHSYLGQFPNDYYVEELDMVDGSWRNFDFSGFDVVYHVAGLAHVNADESQKELYYKVNRDLTIETALKAKREKVKQFIFMSSIIVYGSGIIGKDRIIDINTELTPDNFYGDSKKQAEEGISALSSNNFKVVILRPPMIYGPNSKGNYPRLSSLAKKTPLFPNIKNERSMLYIGNLFNFIKLIIDNEESGIFLPQNKDYVCSSELVQLIATISNHKIYFVKLFNPFIKALSNKTVINKVFGNFVIDKKLSKYKMDYNKYSFEESIQITEKNR